jgi:hypothetical protein
MSSEHQAKFLSGLWTSICTIAERDGVVPLNKLPGLWKFEAGDFWLTVNPHREKIEEVDPYTVNVERNGWPIAMIGPYDACFIVDGLQSMFALDKALKERAGSNANLDKP